MKPTIRFLSLLSLSALLGAGCAAAHKGLAAPVLAPLALTEQAPAPLERDHFGRDASGSISEEDLRTVLAAPVFLEGSARLGVLQVADRYHPDEELPLPATPAELCRAMQDAGLFDVTTEISTDWPADSGLSGLRELAARYRAEYLLLYRHRFVEDSYANAWGWLGLTVIGGLLAPARTLEAVGVLEATLFDVKTGTILFTVFERVRGTSDETVWYLDRKGRALQERLLTEATRALADQVVGKTRLLAAARPTPTTSLAAGSPPPPDQAVSDLSP